MRPPPLPNRILLLLVLAVLFAPRAARAQMIPTSLELDAGAGFFWFAQESENFKHNVDFNAKLNLHFTSIVGFEASLGIVPTRLLEDEIKVSYINPNFGLIFHLTKWKVVPFVYVGAGFSRYSILGKYKGVETIPREDCNSTSDFTQQNGQYLARDIDFQVAAGAGLKLLLTERFGIRMDGRYLFTHDKRGQDPVVTVEQTPNGDGTSSVACRAFNNFHHVEFTGSLFVLIGGKLDTDGDGIANNVDQCKEVPEDLDGFEDADGCPELDNDRDGIPDELDQCEMDPEDADGFEDKDGCPDLDNDKDGVLDAQDRCPMEPEDRDSYEDDDGCPELDNDGDGIKDSRDDCPLEPDDKDGWEDQDGCPELDNDRDGFLDAQDDCPNSAGKASAIPGKNGCPENDTDKDGILDEEDQCPTDPEDRDGFEDTDGCPDRDNDNDGVYDAMDRCPMDGEDKDGWEDNDGCPDIDNDGDNILDNVDGCPNDKENRNGFEDEDGCPDELPEEVKKFTGVISDIKFKLNSDELLTSSFPILNEAADILTEYPGIRMEIQGHASADGDDMHNMVLSQKRSESVRRYLVNRSVDPSRLTAVGYGETVPIADNGTKEGRMMNRRVEFKIVQPAE